jgi:hypothetical protein
MCLDPISLLTGGLVGFFAPKKSTPALFPMPQMPEQPSIANYALKGQLYKKSLKKRRSNVKTSPLGLEDEETQKKQLTGE